jgi:phosphosulfolactate synthase (CoM biosynthesis protein A)
MMWPAVDPNSIMEYIQEIGAEHLIANTDFGQVLVPHPIEGLRLYIRGMFHWGISKEDIKTMFQTNPAKYLYLDE